MYSEYTYNDFPVTNGYSYPRNHFNNVSLPHVLFSFKHADMGSLMASCFLQRYKNPGPYKVSLKMGSREYIAEGSSAQIARHKAARKALEDLRNLPEPDMNGNIQFSIHLLLIHMYILVHTIRSQKILIGSVWLCF